MPIRKIGLLGCSNGPWVSARDMKAPHIEVSGLAGRILVQCSQAPVPEGETAMMKEITESGIHALIPCLWLQVIVIEGDASELLCVFIDRKSEAA